MTGNSNENQCANLYEHFEFKSDSCERIFPLGNKFSLRPGQLSVPVSASASDVSVIVSAYDDIRPQPRGLPTGEGCVRVTGCSLTGQNGSPPAGHPLPLFALPEVCQASGSKTHTNTHAHTHLKVGTWKELSDHRMPPHLRPDLGPKQTRKTKRALIQTILLALLPWNGTQGGEGGGGDNHRV